MSDGINDMHREYEDYEDLCFKRSVRPLGIYSGKWYSHYISLSKERNKDESISTSWKIQKITENLNKFLQEKNKRYGNSALEPLEGIDYTVEDGIKIRLVDKLKRIINSKELRKNDVVDTLGYVVLLCADNDWTTFDDLID